MGVCACVCVCVCVNGWVSTSSSTSTSTSTTNAAAATTTTTTTTTVCTSAYNYHHHYRLHLRLLRVRHVRALQRGALHPRNRVIIRRSSSVLRSAARQARHLRGGGTSGEQGPVALPRGVAQWRCPVTLPRGAAMRRVPVARSCGWGRLEAGCEDLAGWERAEWVVLWAVLRCESGLWRLHSALFGTSAPESPSEAALAVSDSTLSPPVMRIPDAASDARETWLKMRKSSC